MSFDLVLMVLATANIVMAIVEGFRGNDDQVTKYGVLAILLLQVAAL